MSVPSRTSIGQRRRIGLTTLSMRAFGYAALWAILSGGRGWGIGVPVIVLSAIASAFVSPANRWSLKGVARFVPYFFWNSLRAGVDVAARALNPALPIDPTVLRYEMQLDSTAARIVMANTVTLLPGTLSADLQGNVLRVHVLNASANFMDMLDTLERRVADLFPQDCKERTR